MQSHVGIFSNQNYRFYTLIGMNGVSGPGPVHSTVTKFSYVAWITYKDFFFTYPMWVYLAN